MRQRIQERLDDLSEKALRLLVLVSKQLKNCWSHFPGIGKIAHPLMLSVVQLITALAFSKAFLHALCICLLVFLVSLIDDIQIEEYEYVPDWKPLSNPVKSAEIRLDIIESDIAVWEAEQRTIHQHLYDTAEDRLTTIFGSHTSSHE